MRLIDADKLAEEVNDVFSDSRIAYGAMIGRQPTVEAAQEWIQCKERLPEETGSYLVTMREKDKSETEWNYHTDVAIYDVTREVWETFKDWYEGQDCELVAWQQLPDPCKV